MASFTIKEALESGNLTQLLEIEKVILEWFKSVEWAGSGSMEIVEKKYHLGRVLADADQRIADSMRALGIGGPMAQNLLTAGPADAAPDYFLMLGVAFGFMMLCMAARYMLARMRRHERPGPGPTIEEVKSLFTVRCPHIAALGGAPSLVVGGARGAAYCVTCSVRMGKGEKRGCPLSEQLFFDAVRVLMNETSLR